MKAVHTQGGAHKTRSIPTVGVLLFKGAAVVFPASSEVSGSPHTGRGIDEEVKIQGSAHTRLCTKRAVCSHHRSPAM